MALRPGTDVGPYRIEGAIGAGGMGEVYRARDTRLQRDVALKVIASETGMGADRLSRFEREAHAYHYGRYLQDLYLIEGLR